MVYLTLAEVCVFYGFMVRNVNIKVLVTALISALLGCTCIKSWKQTCFFLFYVWFCGSDHSSTTTRSHGHTVDAISEIIKVWPLTWNEPTNEHWKQTKKKTNQKHHSKNENHENSSTGSDQGYFLPILLL